jgi:hypothetical protein
MPGLQHPDVLQAASYRQMIAHLPGPFAAGAADAPIPITAAGQVQVSRITRQPLLVAAPKDPLGKTGLRLSAVLDPAGANTPLDPPLDFFPYTEAGAFLPLYRPPTDPQLGTAAAFTVGLTLVEVREDGTTAAVPAAQIANRFEVRLIEGVMGRLAFALSAEKARLRREAREIAAMRLLGLARDDALDRLGAELGVPRFVDAIQFDKIRKEIITVVRVDATGLPIDEPDIEYRRRLRIFRPWQVPSRRRLLDLLNGPGAAADPNRGPLGELGLVPRFDILEADNEFAVAIQLISSGADQQRVNFLNHVRGTRLIFPSSATQANTIHAARFLPSATKAEINQLRTRLRARFLFDNTAAIAPMLARSLDRAGRARLALGLQTQWRVLRTQDSSAGSRYELGLGADLEPLAAAELNQMRAALLNPQRAPASEPEIEVLLKSMTPKTAAEDPEASWFLLPCGIRTVHRVDAGRIYVSHLPVFGLRITGPSNTVPGTKVDLEVRYNAPGDPGGHVVLVDAIAETAKRWTAGGGPAFTVLSDAAAVARWNQVNPTPANPAGVFQRAGLRAINKVPPVVTQLKNLPIELISTIVLGAAQAAAILNNQNTPENDLRKLTGLFRDQGVTSLLPLVTSANEVLLAVGVIGLPEVGLNLSERRASGFRWYAVPIKGPAGDFKSVGSRTFFTPKDTGLTAMVALGYARRGLTDPYEYRIQLPDAARVSLLQYEFLMNMLDHVYPLGIEINTFTVRQRNVDLDGDGNAEPLPPAISRTFRRFRRRRHRGEAASTLSPGEKN